LIVVWVFTLRATPPAADQVAATLRSGTLQFETGTRLLARQVRDVAAVAARDPGLTAALAGGEGGRGAAPRPGAKGAAPAPPTAAPPDPAGVAEAAEAAIRAAASLLDIDVGQAPLVGVSHDGVLALRAGARTFAARDALPQALLGGNGAPRHVRIEEAIYAVAVVPAGKGGALAFGLPIDPRWTERLQAATGADLTLLGKTPVSTLSPGEAAAVIAAATKGAGGVDDAGRLAPVSLAPGLPAVPIFLVDAPAYRARALSLPGLDGPAAVVSAPAARALEPVGAFQQVALLAILLLGVVGVALGFTREPAVASHVPRELAAVADRIAHGDFDVRVPRMSGTFGTLASALARAADGARLARRSPAVASGSPAPGPASGPPYRSATLTPPMPAPTLDVPLLAVPPEESTGSRGIEDPFSAHGMAPPGTPTPVPVPASGAAAGSSAAAAAVLAAQAARAVHPRTTQPIGLDGAGPPSRPTPAPISRPTPVASARPAPTPVGPAAPLPPGSDEALWLPVYHEFLKVRGDSGESVEGISWERFRDKLRKNRDALAQKYACRTVRFTVYVKEGRAALKATPVR
jgi:hypothetical protein